MIHQETTYTTNVMKRKFQKPTSFYLAGELCHDMI